MSRPTVSARLRRENGKGPARRLRTQGQVPAVLYGGEKGPVSLALDPRMLIRALDPALKRNTLLQLDVEESPDMACLALVKDTQMDTLKDVLLHVDLIRVTEDQPVEVTVPFALTGRAEGIKLGGTLQQIFHALPLRAPAGRIPPTIEVDTTSWPINFQLRVSDLTVPADVSVLLDPKQKLAALLAKSAEKAETTTAEGEAEAG